MINFVFDGKKYITVSADELPPTIIKCESGSNEMVLSTCENWLKALGLSEREYQVSVRLH